MAGAVLEIKDLDVRLGRRQVLVGVSLEVAAGESVAIMGRTGSGKSTLLSCVAGLTRPTGGVVRLTGQDVAKLRPADLSAFRRSTMGIVFQHGELLPALTTLENVALPAVLDGAEPEAASRRARDLLERLDVPVLDGPAGVLSGGERQRAGLARALINDPKLLVADEPTGALDTETRDEVNDVIFKQPGQTGCALLVVTHDPVVAARADRVYRISDGRLVAQGQLA